MARGSTVTKDCKHCNTPFTIPKSWDHREHSCSAECKAAIRKAKVETLAAERARNCRHCGESFRAKKSQLDVGGGIYCSNKCQFAFVTYSPIHTPESREKAAAARAEGRASGRIRPLSGELNKRWKGGPEASKARADKRLLNQKRREYRQANPARTREWKLRRKSLIHGRLPRGTIPRIGESQSWLCVCCRVDVSEKFHVDHIMPLAKGGEHTPFNIQLLCPRCNVRKSAKHPVDFMQENGYLL